MTRATWGRMAGAGAAVAAVLSMIIGSAAPALAAPGPPGSREWWFDTWGVESLWAGGARGQGIVIAEVDTGINTKVPELAGKILDGQDFGDSSTKGHTDHDLDAFGHGTAMASLMVAEPGYADVTGMAPDARILPIAVPLAETDIASAPYSTPQAVRFAADNGAKIISMSLGGDRDPAQDSVPCPVETQDAITYAISKGLIVVAASGNQGEEGSPVTEPGVCIGVIAVGAVDVNNEVTSFSSRHPYLTVTAPGENIPTLGKIPGQAYIGAGTSQATAITSAAIALIWSKYPTATNDQIVARLLATLDHKAPTSSPDPAYGYGIINPGAAINTAVAADAPNPLYDALTPFLQRAAAKTAATAAPPPSPAPVSDTPPGDVVVGTRPSLVDGPVLQGAGLSGVGVVLLLVLFVIGFRRRRRYVAAMASYNAALPPPPQFYGPPPGATWSPTPTSGPTWAPQSGPESVPSSEPRLAPDAGVEPQPRPEAVVPRDEVE